MRACASSPRNPTRPLGELPGNIVLVGDGAKLAGLPEAFSGAYDGPVRIGCASGMDGLPEDELAELPSLCTVYGLALQSAWVKSGYHSPLIDGIIGPALGPRDTNRRQ